MANPFPFMHAGPMMPGGPMPPPPPPMTMAGPSGLMGPAQLPQPQIGPQAMPPGMINMLDPATNNQPLQFNTNKGKPPMPVMGEVQEVERIPMGIVRADKVVRDRDRERDTDRERSRSAESDGGIEGNGMMGMMPNIMGGPMGYGPMMGDPSMMMMGPMGFNQFGSYQMGMSMQGGGGDIPGSQKEIIRLKGAVLYPPPPNAPPPTTRERPPGCRTIFVGGLPDNITEEILREMFENCGVICSIRVSKKNFAHIRYEAEESVENSLYLSGYRMKIDDKDDKPNTGRIHVDYAQARDDLYEWECKQRSLAREMRHRSRLEEERLRPPSPPPIIHYSDHEASMLMEKLKADDSFMKGTQVLVTWLERGDCSRRSANTFYGMIQSVNSHVRRLMNEKATHDQELEQMKLAFRQRHEGILRQMEQIEKVFSTAGKQKSWDHFSKAQRKNLDIWRKQAEEIRKMNQEEFLRDRQEDEMEMSDNEEDGPVPKKSRKPDEPGFNMEVVQNLAMITRLQEENDNMKCQLEAYKNEIELTKKEQDNTGETKDKQIKALQQALQGMQQQLITFRSQSKKDEEEVTRLRKEIKTVKTAAVAASSKDGEDGGDKEDGSGRDGRDDAEPISSSGAVDKRPQPQPLSDTDGRLVGILSTFLWVHPFGASLDYIWSYLQRLEIQIRTSEIEDLLERMPSVFKQDLMGVGASLEKRWKFVGFESPLSF